MTPRNRLAALAAGLAATAALAAGCGQAGSSPAAKATSATKAANASGTSGHKAVMCGSSKTPANVPVKVEVVSGSVACPEALAVEHAYTAAVTAGREAGGSGDGGGGVQVSGWRCQAFSTPVMVQTGNVSKCLRDGTEIMTVLPPLP
jgi:hypothetical protein